MVLDRLKDIALSQGLDEGLSSCVARLAQKHPRPSRTDVEADPQATTARRQTQRVMKGEQAETAPTQMAHSRGFPWKIAGSLASVGGLLYLLILVAPAAKNKDEPPPAQGKIQVQEPKSKNAPKTTMPQTPNTPKQAEPLESAQKKSIPPTPPAPSKKRASDSAKKEKVSANQGFGKLNLNSKPWAWVEIDGNPLGKTTPVVLPQIPAGPHTIRLRNGDQGLEKTIQIFIKAKETTREFIDLTR